MPVSPVLHVAQSAAHAPVDARIIAAGACALAAVVGATFAPRCRLCVTPRALRLLVALALLFAVLPSVVPFDHLLPGAAAHDIGDDAVHAAHCHIAPGSCADAPLTAGPGQLLAATPLVSLPAMIAVLIVISLPSIAGSSPRPETPPPVA